MKQNLKKYLNIWLLLFMSFPCVAKDSKAGMVLHPVYKEYVTPILYDLKYAKKPEMCQVLLDVVNKDIKKSLFVDYSNTKYFVPWQLVEGAESHPIFKHTYKSYKEWRLKHTPPKAYNIVDIDNDGFREYLYIYSTLRPRYSQHFFVLKNKPLGEWGVLGSLDKQRSLDINFILTQKKTNNLDLNLNGLRGVINLDEELELKNTYSRYFDFGKAFYFVFKYHQKNYLIADPVNYKTNNYSFDEETPFFLLLSVLPSDNVEIECVLKRHE